MITWFCRNTKHLRIVIARFHDISTNDYTTYEFKLHTRGIGHWREYNHEIDFVFHSIALELGTFYISLEEVRKNVDVDSIRTTYTEHSPRRNIESIILYFTEYKE